jgi:NitT/TauT family transport system substrate-binding protein
MQVEFQSRDCWTFPWYAVCILPPNSSPHCAAKGCATMIHRLFCSTVAAATLMMGAQAFAADKVIYLLDWLPSGEETFPYVAQKEGFFAEANLDVEIRIGRGTTDVLAKMASGNGEFGSGGLGGLMNAAAQGPLPVKAVFSIFNKQPDAIFTYEGSGIKTIKDLAGRTVATATFTSSNALFPVIAEINGLDLSKVTLIKADPTVTSPMVASGKADALINWVTSGGEIETVLKQAGKKMVVVPWSDFGLDGYGLALFASDAVIKDKPDVVRRFVAACQKAIVFSLDHPEQAAKDLVEMVPALDLESQVIEVHTTIPVTRNEISDKYGLGTFEPTLVKHTWQWIAKSQNYPLDKLNPETVIDRSFVPAK